MTASVAVSTISIALSPSSREIGIMAEWRARHRFEAHYERSRGSGRRRGSSHSTGLRGRPADLAPRYCASTVVGSLVISSITEAMAAYGWRRKDDRAPVTGRGRHVSRPG
jgi:hypothetical protein